MLENKHPGSPSVDGFRQQCRIGRDCSSFAQRLIHGVEMTAAHRSRIMEADLLSDTEAADASGSPRPPLVAEEEADAATREVLNDAEMIIGMIEGIEDVMAGDVITLEEQRAEKCQPGAEGQRVAG